MHGSDFDDDCGAECMSLPRYAEYKPSGVAWLGDVPEHWDVLKLKRICALRSGEGITSEEIEEDGEYPVYGGNGLRGYTNKFTHEGRYALIGRQGALCGNVNYANGKFWASEHAVVVSPIQMVVTSWLGELLRAMNLNQYSITAAQPGLAVEAVGNLFIPLPPDKEQQTIAAFLDRETGKIDALIASQRRLVELLAEKRQAVISHAVTKGLNPNAPMKDSGIEWLGDVPKHWEVKPMRMVANVVRGASPRPAGDPRYFGGDAVPWVTVGEITKDDSVYLTETETWLTQEGAAHSNLFPTGTVIYSNSGATLGVPKVLHIDACANDGVVAFLNLNSQVQAEFLFHYLASITDSIREKVKQGSGQPNLNTDIVKDLRFGLPPLDEQKSIVRRIAELADQFGSLTAEANRTIELLQERRSALISAAVTGKIDVREARLLEIA
jgi:type I restriction enzyme, S subunit